MSDNPSFVLKAIENVVFEERPIPDVGPKDVLVEVKKTGEILRSTVLSWDQT